MPEAPRRPLPVTMACFFVIFSSVLIVVNLASALSQWGSLDMQESLRDMLATEPLASMDIAMDDLLGLLEILAQVVIVLAIAAGVFAVYVIRGHEPSRWILSGMLVLAGVMFAATGLVGILPGVMAFVAAAVLWTQDSRQWFAAKNGRPPVQARTRGGAAARPDPFATATAPPEASAPVHPSTSPHPAQPAPSHQGVAQQPGATGPPPVDPARRPRPVTVAVWVAGASSAAVAGLCGLGLLAVLVGGDLYREALEQPGFLQDYLSSSGWSAEGFLTFMQAAFGGFLVLGLVGLAVALWARTGHPVARGALVAMSILTLVVSVVATLGFIPFNLLTGAAAIVVLVQLRNPLARAWFARSTA
ncbi:hypothetical protein ACHAAC_07900 [Aeromicrobium sp. CF4.19]|uniref:hypothetical protein n=1 Tax=Aeromicrobium sp. CF4.19 TaxID=3373082 RepID=UPI003EE54B8E